MPIFASFPASASPHRPPPAEICEDRVRFPTAATLLAESRLAPVTRASGRRSRKFRLRYTANTVLRAAAMWWAFNSMNSAPWAKAAFRDARDQRGTTPARFVAWPPAGCACS